MLLCMRRDFTPATALQGKTFPHHPDPPSHPFVDAGRYRRLVSGASSSLGPCFQDNDSTMDLRNACDRIKSASRDDRTARSILLAEIWKYCRPNIDCEH